MDLGGNFVKEPFIAGACAPNGKCHAATTADVGIYGGRSPQGDTVRMNVFGDADHLIPDPAQHNPLAEGGDGISPILACHVLRDDSDRASAENIVPRKITTRGEPCSLRSEETGRHCLKR